MLDYQMGGVETRFAEIIWNNEPISSTELVKLCANEFDWKKSTTYTVLKRLCDKGIFKNEQGTVSSVIGRDEFYSLQSERFIETNFSGSLPAFITSFSKKRELSREDIEQIKAMLDEYSEGLK
jgi:predicted transcriptional regulator